VLGFSRAQEVTSDFSSNDSDRIEYLKTAFSAPNPPPNRP